MIAVRSHHVVAIEPWGECHMTGISQSRRSLSVILTSLTLVAGCVTVDDPTPTKEGTTPKEDTRAGIERQKSPTADQRAWIENACPRDIIGPGPWKRCIERNLQALQAGLPDLSALASADRAWIENACPRDIIGPGPWKRCAERNLQALQPRLPEPDFDANGASRDPASAGRVNHKDGEGSTVATRAEPREIVEGTTRSESTGHTTTSTPPDPPRLAAPFDGERWFCYTSPLSSLFDQSPEIVLTREGKTDRPFGKGQVLVADVIYDAIFQIEGIGRRWDWNDGTDSISINPSRDGAYYDFRLLKSGETRLPPTQQLWCNQK